MSTFHLAESALILWIWLLYLLLLPRGTISVGSMFILPFPKLVLRFKFAGLGLAGCYFYYTRDYCAEDFPTSTGSYLMFQISFLPFFHFFKWESWPLYRHLCGVGAVINILMMSMYQDLDQIICWFIVVFVNLVGFAGGFSGVRGMAFDVFNSRSKDYYFPKTIGLKSF
jgi:hypothetical protein